MNSAFRGMSGKSRMRGFNLIELLVTLAIIAIAIGIGVPMYGTFTQESSVSGATSELIAALADARSRATSDRTTIQVRAIDDDWVNGWQIYRPRDDEVLFNVARSDRSIAISELNDEVEVSFDTEGRLMGVREFDIRIQGGEGGSPVRTLAISSFGRVEVTKSRVDF